MVEQALLSVGSFRKVPIGTGLWESGDQNSRMWQWTLHSLQPLDALFAIGAFDLVAAHVEEWERRFSHRPVSDDFPWHDHATALRLDRLSRLALETGIPKFEELAARHCELLLREEFYEKHTNHGFDQAVSLILAAAAFSGQAEASKWLEIGQKRLEDEIRIAFTTEGVHIENSPGYHAGMLRNLDRARGVRDLTGGQVEVFTQEFLEGAVGFMAWATRPDRFLSYFGDTARMRPNVPDIAKKTEAFGALEWAATGGVSGSAPKESSKVFEEAGYAFYRSSWEDWSQQVYLAVKSGFLSRYHRQDDDLNVLLHAFGEDWLIDSGLYSHNQRDPIRLYMRSAEAHNVPMIVGSVPRRSLDRGAHLAAVPNSEHVFEVDCFTSIYPEASLHRRIWVQRNGQIHIRDRIRTKSEAPVQWLFHVPSDKKVSVAPGKARIVGKRKSLLIRVAGGKSLKAELHRGFHGAVKSVVSQRPNQLEESQVVRFGPDNCRDVRFVLTFEDYSQNK